MKFMDIITGNILYAIGIIIFLITITSEYPYQFYYGSTSIVAFVCGKALNLMIGMMKK